LNVVFQLDANTVPYGDKAPLIGLPTGLNINWGGPA
jgi:hypothetical protein